MDIDKLFTIVTNYESTNLTLWNIYIAVILGLLVYAIGSERVKNITIRIVLCIGFLAFSYGNSAYLERNQLVINAVSGEITEKLKSSKKVSQIYKQEIANWHSLQPKSLLPMHYTIDCFVVILILFGPYLVSLVKSSEQVVT